MAKCDNNKKTKIYEPLGFVLIFRAIKTKNVSFLKIGMMVQIVGKILPQLCSNDSIQIPLKTAWFSKSVTKPI